VLFRSDKAQAHAQARASDRMNDFETASVSSIGSISITEQKQNFDSLYKKLIFLASYYLAWQKL
jgi:hypothetical protein